MKKQEIEQKMQELRDELRSKVEYIHELWNSKEYYKDRFILGQKKIEKLKEKLNERNDEIINRLINLKDASECTEKEIEFFVKHNEKVRKETAKEIYNWLNEHAYYEEEMQLVNAFHEAFLEDEE